MRINLQKFGLSTLTFSLATTLAVAGFSESANAQTRGGGSGYGTSPNVPALNFDVFLEDEKGEFIEDEFKKNDNLGVFKNAIEIINIPGSDILTIVRKVDLEKNSGATLKGSFDSFGDPRFTFDNDRTPASFSAELTELDQKKFITYQIFRDNDDQLDDDDYKNPDQFLKFAPVDVSSRSENDINNLVNNLGFILDDGKEGTYDVISQNNLVGKPQVGVLGKAIDLSLDFQGEEDPDNFKDFLQIKKFAPQPSTSIPEPTTTLASIFVLGFAGKFLRKSKKNNA
ncbi:MAG: hypothetical protein MJK14_13445 [Rivularia sp. ALOHA_DT_140]|nr:hypothetical protein [Rivularia sp. ALOHA_DT_140]